MKLNSGDLLILGTFAKRDICVGPSAPSKPVRSYVPGSGSERCFPFAAAECPRGTDQLYSIPGNPGLLLLSTSCFASKI